MINDRAMKAARASLGWISALMVATAGLMGAMSLAPAAAQESTIDAGGESKTSRSLVLAPGKAAIIELPRAAADVLVSAPEVIETVIRTPRRVYVMARGPGLANAFFFDTQGQQILNLEITVQPTTQDIAVIEDVIERLLPTTRVTVEMIGNSLLLHGSSNSPGEAERAVQIAERFAAAGSLGGGAAGAAGGGIQAEVVNMIEVREPGQVMLKVRVVEMQRSLTRQLGVDLSGVAQLDDALIDFAVETAGPTGGGLGTDIFTNGFSDITRLDFALDVFEENGLVKTLAEPSLIALSGQEAQFFAGGKILFPVQTGLGTVGVEEERFGVELKFQPTVRSKGSINLVLSTSVSEINDSLGTVVGGGFVEDPVSGEFVRVGTSTIPGFSQRATTTTVDLPSGASFAIAGLLQEDIQEVVDGVPGAKEVPVLGQLFRSQSFRRNETELVIIATPYLVEPTSLAELTDPSVGFAPPSAVESILLGRMESAFGVRSRGVSEAGLQGPVGFILD